MREKKKITWKLNLFDTGLIVLALVAVAVVAVMKFGGSSTPAIDPTTSVPAPESVRYVVQLEQALPQTAEMVEVGQQLYERTKKEDMGIIESVDVAPAQTLTKNELDGTYHFATIPDRVDITMVLSSPASFQSGAITLSSGLEVRAGTAVRVFGPGYYGSGYVLSVERG